MTVPRSVPLRKYESRYTGAAEAESAATPFPTLSTTKAAFEVVEPHGGLNVTDGVAVIDGVWEGVEV